MAFTAEKSDTDFSVVCGAGRLIRIRSFPGVLPGFPGFSVYSADRVRVRFGYLGIGLPDHQYAAGYRRVVLSVRVPAGAGMRSSERNAYPAYASGRRMRPQVTTKKAAGKKVSKFPYW